MYSITELAICKFLRLHTQFYALSRSLDILLAYLANVRIFQTSEIRIPRVENNYVEFDLSRKLYKRSTVEMITIIKKIMNSSIGFRRQESTLNVIEAS